MARIRLNLTRDRTPNCDVFNFAHANGGLPGKILGALIPQPAVSLVNNINLTFARNYLRTPCATMDWEATPQISDPIWGVGSIS